MSEASSPGSHPSGTGTATRVIRRPAALDQSETNLRLGSGPRGAFSPYSVRNARRIRYCSAVILSCYSYMGALRWHISANNLRATNIQAPDRTHSAFRRVIVAEQRLRAHERVARVDAGLAVGAGRIGPLAQQLLRVRRHHRVGEVRAFYRFGVGDGAREV